MATITEALYGLLRGAKDQSEQIAAMIKRHDELVVWLREYFANQQPLVKTPSRPPPWFPTSKKELTGIAALVVFALTVLAIILASCGVIGCQELQEITK